MPHSKNIHRYGDQARVFQTVLQNNGGVYTLLTEKAAKAWLSRAYQYLRLLAEHNERQGRELRT